MKATQQLHDAGQSLWLDNITRRLLTSGTLRQYIAELSITGLTSNPTIFDHAIRNSQDYDDAIRQKIALGKSGEALFFELALEDLTQAADLFRPVHDLTDGIDGWVSLEVSPLLAYDAKSTVAEAKQLSARAARPNLFIKIPGTSARTHRHRGSHLCWRPGQRDTPVLSRSVPRSRASLYAGYRTAHSRWAEPCCTFRRLGLREPLGQRNSGAGAS